MTLTGLTWITAYCSEARSPAPPPNELGTGGQRPSMASGTAFSPGGLRTVGVEAGYRPVFYFHCYMLDRDGM